MRCTNTHILTERLLATLASSNAEKVAESDRVEMEDHTLAEEKKI